MAIILELRGQIAPEPPFLREAGIDVANPKNGVPGPLREIGSPTLSIDPSGAAINPEDPNASRIIPGSRLVETNSAKVAAELIATGLFSPGGHLLGGIFTEDATQLRRASAAEIAANQYAQKLANQLNYGLAAQSGSFYGYAGLGTVGVPEGNQVKVEFFQYTDAVYIVPANQPRVKVWFVKQEALNGGNLQAEETLQPGGESSNLQASFEAVPMPIPGDLPLGQIWPEGTDRRVTIYCPATDELWEIWRLGQFAAGEHKGEWKFAYGAYIPNASKQNGVIQPQAGSATLPHEGWGARASGLIAVGGNISLADLIRVLRGGKIGHALGISAAVTKGPAGTAKLPPAVRNDAKGNTFGTAETNPAFGNVDAVPEGAWFAFPRASSASEFVNPATEPLAAAIYEAIREYGLVITDGGSTCGFCLNDPRALGSPYTGGQQINPFAGATSGGETGTKIATYINAHVPGGWTDATLPVLKEQLFGKTSVFSKLPWRTLEQLAPRAS